MAWFIFPINDIRVVLTITVFYYRFLSIWTNFTPIVFIPLYLIVSLCQRNNFVFFGFSNMQMTLLIFSVYICFLNMRSKFWLVDSWSWETVKVIRSNYPPWLFNILWNNYILIWPKSIPAFSEGGAPVVPCLCCQIRACNSLSKVWKPSFRRFVVI